MFGFLKNLLRRSAESPAESGYSPADGGDDDNLSEPSGPPPRGAATNRPARQAPAPARRSPTGQNLRSVEIPLQKILEVLPLELQPRVQQPDAGDLTISVPLEKVLAQLSKGTVRVSFGELRQAAPEMFTEENDRDRVLVAMPLAEILSRLNPALITRRRAQRQVEVPAEISSPFDSECRGVAIAPNPAKAEAHSGSAASPARRATANSTAPTAPIRGGRASVATAPASPAPEAMSPPPVSPVAPAISSPRPQPIAPVSRAFPASPITPIDPGPASQPAFSSAPAPDPSAPIAFRMPQRSPGSANPVAAVSSPGHNGAHNGRHAPVAFTPAPAPTPAPAVSAPVAADPKSAAGSEPLIISLISVAESWPEAIRKEIVDLNLVEARVALPPASVEQALKQGRIAFSWKTLKTWIKPAMLPSVSAHDGAVLELPLKVVAPVFLARQQEAAKGHQKVSVDEEIPNLFFGAPTPETGKPVAVATAKPADTNFYVWDETKDMVKSPEEENKRGPTPGTKFVAKYATPNEVVSRAAALEGVLGALIALPDGLMVANRLPSDLNADTLAAFLPQIFGKVSQCTKELRMGELNNLNFTVGNVPWKIFRVNAIFFAAFGRAGEALPTAQLAALAAELDHKPK